jgi:hypothetical protein
MNNPSPRSIACPEPSEDLIREYAYHLYEQSNRAPGHDLDNWREAIACLQANIPTDLSRTRMRWYTRNPESGLDNLPATDVHTPAA